MPLLHHLAASPGPPAVTEPPSLPHVLLVLDGFPKTLGGGERVVLRLAAMLPRYGFRVSILTFAIHPETSFDPAQAPCPVYLLPLTNTFGLRAARGALVLRGFLRREKVQVVQTFFESSDLWAGTVTRLLSRAKLVWSRRDMGILRGRKHHLAYRALRRLPHAVAAVSARVAEHVIQVDGVPASRVRVIHNGLDLSGVARSHRASLATGKVVTTIGNVRRVKGHDVLVQAAAAVVAALPEVTFRVAGEVLEPDFFSELEHMIAATGLLGKFQFLGKVTDLPKHLGSADVFVLPSRSEGFSNALIEAMATGLPCVATDVGGNAEAVQDQKSGLIVAPDDVAALSEALLALLQDEDLAQRMGAAAKIAAETEFSSEAMMQKTTALYRELLRR